MPRKAPAPLHTQSPNVFYDEWLKEINSLAELKVVEVVIRNTFGWHADRVKMSLANIKEATGLSKSSAQDGVKRAVKNGYIARVSDGRSFAYEISVDIPESGTCQNDVVPDVSTRSYRNPVTQADPSLDRLKKGKKQEKPLRETEFPDVPFQSKPFQHALSNFQQMCREKKKPLVPTQLAEIFEKMKIWGEEGSIQALKKSTSSGYPDVYYPGTNSNGNGHHSNGVEPPRQRTQYEILKEQGKI